VGQGADLLAGEGHAEAQAQGVLAGQGVVHQVAELVGVAGQAAGEEALAGLREHRVADQAAFVLAITEAAPGVVAGEAEFAEHVVGAEEAGEAGKFRVGFDQIVAGGVGVFDEQAVLALGQLEVGRGDGVDRGEGHAGVVNGYETATRCRGNHRQYAARRLGAGVVGVLAQVDVDATDRDTGLVIAEGAGQLRQGVFVQRAVLRFRVTLERSTVPPA